MTLMSLLTRRVNALTTLLLVWALSCQKTQAQGGRRSSSSASGVLIEAGVRRALENLSSRNLEETSEVSCPLVLSLVEQELPENSCQCTPRNDEANRFDLSCADFCDVCRADVPDDCLEAIFEFVITFQNPSAFTVDERAEVVQYNGLRSDRVALREQVDAVGGTQSCTLQVNGIPCKCTLGTAVDETCHEGDLVLDCSTIMNTEVYNDCRRSTFDIPAASPLACFNERIFPVAHECFGSPVAPPPTAPMPSPRRSLDLIELDSFTIIFEAENLIPEQLAMAIANYLLNELIGAFDDLVEILVEITNIQVLDESARRQLFEEKPTPTTKSTNEGHHHEYFSIMSTSLEFLPTPARRSLQTTQFVTVDFQSRARIDDSPSATIPSLSSLNKAQSFILQDISNLQNFLTSSTSPQVADSLTVQRVLSTGFLAIGPTGMDQTAFTSDVSQRRKPGSFLVKPKQVPRTKIYAPSPVQHRGTSPGAFTRFIEARAKKSKPKRKKGKKMGEDGTKKKVMRSVWKSEKKKKRRTRKGVVVVRHWLDPNEE